MVFPRALAKSAASSLGTSPAHPPLAVHILRVYQLPSAGSPRFHKVPVWQEFQSTPLRNVAPAYAYEASSAAAIFASRTFIASKLILPKTGSSVKSFSR